MKVRSGVYSYREEIAPNTHARFVVEHSPEGIAQFHNKWAVQTIIGGELLWFECAYDAKWLALQAIKEVLENGHYEYSVSLGWCYIDGSPWLGERGLEK